MTDHHDQMKVAPDPVLAEELRQRLHARLANVPLHLELEPSRPVPDETVAPMHEISASRTSTRRPRIHRRRLVAAAAAVAIAATGIAITDRDASDEGLSTTPTTAPLPLDDEEIRVSADLIELGDGLMGGVDKVARASGRTYVSAELVQTEDAVVAAFDDRGRQLWRTELDQEPADVEVAHGDLWVRRGEGVTRLDASDGRVLGEVSVGSVDDMVGAFDSLWVVARMEGIGKGFRLIRVEADLTTNVVELPLSDVQANHEPFGTRIAAGAGALWVPMWADGLAMIDPDTLSVTMIPADEIGFFVNQHVAVDGDVVYVAGGPRVNSIVGGRAQITTNTFASVRYLGPIDGVFGAQLRGGQLDVLQPHDPRVVERRQTSSDEIAGEIDGDAWAETDGNGSLRRVELLPER